MAGKRQLHRKPSDSTVSLKDGDGHKRFPNGLRGLIRSLRKYWPANLVMKGEGHSVETFVEGYISTYNVTAERYGAKKKTSAGGLKRKLDKLEGNGEETRHVNFVDLRALSDHVGLPASGLLLLYSQFISEDARGASLKDQEVFLDRIINGLESLRSYLKACESAGERPFTEPRTGDTYKARLDGLQKLIEGYNAPLSPSRSRK
jgi:hypothetical protein